MQPSKKPTRRVLAVAIAAIATITSIQSGPATAQPVNARLSALVDGMYPSLEAIYKDLHANPELSFQETRTASKLAGEMRSIGLEVTEKVGRTGVVAVYKNGQGPTVLVRADMDALPMEEKTGLPYASKVKAQWNGRETYVAHSCGHDIHVTNLIGTARTLVALKDQWKGTVVFIGQPAEEGGEGAKAMLEDGLFTRFPKPDVAFALHADPMPYGVIGYRSGAVSSSSDGLDIAFKGRGGHGSAPHRTIDPITMAAHFVTDVQTVVSREKDPAEFGVVTIGSIQAGSAGNIIPDSAVLRGTVRSYKPEVREKMLDGIRRTAQAAAAMSGAPEPSIEFKKGGSAIINDEAVVQRAVSAIKAQLTTAKVIEVPPITASEDFSEYVNAGVPSMFFFVGVSDPKAVADASQPGGKPVPFNHSPYFAPVPEPTLKLGVQAMTTAVLSVMSK
ncbi:Amidohydrolase [Comamonas aquatilis]|uniref:amidohydrolase n=1 Tax=Comamonas aquatilis TaxID=1778406 RepID=UPI0039F04CCE